ncbi:Lectin-like protein BA14k [Hyphomicrobium sp. 1Nfss2.1]|uniref:hypothetical protein n=1 Tax=Hyphomicrobium sp. 1Nfss2.1 TaxID=3413936 RepID=UPI003C7AF1A4
MHPARIVIAFGLFAASASVVDAAMPDRRPGVAKPYSSDAHRAGPGGTYGGLKGNPPPPMRGAGDVRDRGSKEPYYYRYYSDDDRSPGSCRKYARRAIATKNDNWWTRYRACLGG